MSVVRFHHEDQVPIGFQGPSQLHLTEFALGDALRQKDQDIARIRHTVAHSPHRWILAKKKHVEEFDVFTCGCIW